MLARGRYVTGAEGLEAMPKTEQLQRARGKVSRAKEREKELRVESKTRKSD